MRRPHVLLLGALAFSIAGWACSSSSSSADAGTPEDAGIDSVCGHPGDPGNSLGVGKFCSLPSDCAGTAAPTLCATLGDPRAHFCVLNCRATDAGFDASGDASIYDEAGLALYCGENATCACNGSGQCGCTPNSCLGK